MAEQKQRKVRRAIAMLVSCNERVSDALKTVLASSKREGRPSKHLFPPLKKDTRDSVRLIKEKRGVGGAHISRTCKIAVELYELCSGRRSGQRALTGSAAL